MKTQILLLMLSMMSCTPPSFFDDPTSTVAEVQKKYKASETFTTSALNWASAVRLVNRWGQVQVAVPLLTDHRKVSAAAGSFREYLVLSSSGQEEFVVQIIGDKGWASALQNYDRLNPPGFTGKILKRDVKSEVSSGYTFKEGKVLGKIFGNASAIKSTRGTTEDCWEIVLITYYNDGTTTREHLYFICTSGQVEEDVSGDGGSGSGSGESGTCNFDPDATYASAVNESAVTAFEDNLERQRAYAWKAVIGPTFSIFSHEIGVHRRASVSDPWKWHSLTHVKLSLTGYAPGVKINPSLNTAISTLGEYYANMSLSINVMYSFFCAGTPMDTPKNYETNMNFYVG